MRSITAKKPISVQKLRAAIVVAQRYLEEIMSEIKKEKGEKRQFETGATKQAAVGKGMPSLIPGDAILDVSKHFEAGAPIHGARNWEKGIPLSVILDSLERHLQQIKMGMTDEPHARALVWNALVYLATKLRTENGLLPASLDDMPDYQSVADAAVIKNSINVTGAVSGRLTTDSPNAIEIDKPESKPRFKVGDKVKIKLKDSILCESVAIPVKEAGGVGTCLGICRAGCRAECDVYYEVLVAGKMLWLFSDEVFPIADSVGGK